MARDDAASSVEALQEICKRPGFMLKRIHQVAMALFLQECRQFGITPSQYQALAGVRAYPGRIKCALLGWHALMHALAEPVEHAGDAPKEMSA